MLAIMGRCGLEISLWKWKLGITVRQNKGLFLPFVYYISEPHNTTLLWYIQLSDTVSLSSTSPAGIWKVDRRTQRNVGRETEENWRYSSTEVGTISHCFRKKSWMHIKQWQLLFQQSLWCEMQSTKHCPKYATPL